MMTTEADTSQLDFLEREAREADDRGYAHLCKSP
jgi:hypothetical protein